MTSSFLRDISERLPQSHPRAMSPNLQAPDRLAGDSRDLFVSQTLDVFQYESLSVLER